MTLTHTIIQYSSASSTAPTLKWGVVSGELLHSVKATTGHIEKSQMCGGVANSTGWRDLGLTHTALLSGMTALGGKSIYYMYGDEHTQDYSAEMVFFVPTPKGVILPSRYSALDVIPVFRLSHLATLLLVLDLKFIDLH